VFVILDIILDDKDLSSVLRIRGLFRLLRVGILIRKFDAIRKKSAAKKKLQIKDFYHVSSPAEIVNEILCHIRDLIKNDNSLIEDVNYCIKMVSSGKLYETNVLEGQDDGGDAKKKNALSWVKSIQGNTGEKRKSAENSSMIKEKVSNIDIVKKLNLTPKAIKMLDKVDTIDFNIFEFKEEVEEQEMYVISSYLLHKLNLFSK
jgi:hypothetical protein